MTDKLTTLPKLGKRAVRRDARNLKLARYLALPAPPAEASFVTHVAQWPMMLNDSLGDCVIAAFGHCIEQWTQYAAGSPVILPDSVIERGYEAVGGYVPGNPATDNGCDMLTACNYWRQAGLDGHKVLAFVQVDPKNVNEVKSAVQLFGNIYIGLALPLSAQGQTAWTVPTGGPQGNGSPGSWGGHCVPVVAYSPKTLTCVTWGQTLKMSWNFFHDYCDEAYALLSPDWIEKSGLSPSHFDLAALQKDLAAL